MGSARGDFTCLFSSTSSQRPENIYSSVRTYYQYLRQRRGIAKKILLTIRAIMIGEHVDLVAAGFNGTAWRCSNRNNIRTIEESFADCALPTLPGPTLLWGPGSIPNNWADVCGFLTPPESDRYCKIRLHGAFSMPHKTLGLRPTDQSCHHETWLHLEFVDWRSAQLHHEGTPSTNSLERTSCAVPLRPAEKAHQRYHERPFALFVTFVTLRPFARVQQCYVGNACILTK